MNTTKWRLIIYGLISFLQVALVNMKRDMDWFDALFLFLSAVLAALITCRAYMDQSSTPTEAPTVSKIVQADK